MRRITDAGTIETLLLNRDAIVLEVRGVTKLPTLFRGAPLNQVTLAYRTSDDAQPRELRLTGRASEFKKLATMCHDLELTLHLTKNRRRPSSPRRRLRSR